MEKKIKVISGGKERLVSPGTRYAELAAMEGGFGRQDAVLAFADGKLQELSKPIWRDCTVEWIGTDHPAGRMTCNRTACMILFKALWDVLGKEQGAGAVLHFVVPEGYYLTITGLERVDDALLDRIRSRMQELVDARIPIVKRNVPAEEALEIFRRQGMKDKENLLRYRKSSRINLYGLEDYWDYYYGYMAMDTGFVQTFDLTVKDEGFVLKLPMENTDAVPAGPKLFRIQKQTETWGEKLSLDTVGHLNDRITSEGILKMILMQETVCENQIARITDDIRQRDNIRFVMVAGPSSSGKTSFSHRLAVQLSACGFVPRPIALDNYFRNREDTPLDEFGERDFECLGAIDTELFNKDMTAFLEGKDTELPTYNFITGKREYNGDILKSGDRDILILEGIHGLNDELSRSLPRESKYKIYISPLTTMNIDEHNIISPMDARLIRRMVRDARTRGIRVGETIRRWASVRRGEEKHIFPFREEADMIFNSYQVYEMSALKVYAEPLLAGIPKEDYAYLEARRLIKLMDYFLPIPSDNIPRNSLLREFIGGSCFPVG